jgi:pyruvate/2-oxoglutarate dehydrogenase complex dihydrolipoamide dehydrogenase (E3) component
VPVRTATRVIEARSAGSQVKLVIDNGEREEVRYDHVIAGTGFRVDLGRLGYLSDELRKGVRVAGGAPVLTRSFESTVPNLFFVGAMAAPSLGPVTRFLAGTHFTARRLARRLSSRQKPSVAKDSADTGVDLSSAASV